VSKSILGWHFLPMDRRLLHDDGREVKVGETVKFDGTLKLCSSGLHASLDLWHALGYAPGPVLCRVRCSGQLLHDTDKLVCTERTVLWMADATDMLRESARLCALDVIHLWDAPAIVIEYLKTGNETKRAAAWAAARAAAGDAARAAAGAAAWDAAWDAAWAAARAAAMAAAGAAAWAAAVAAAWDAAWDAAWAAAEKNQEQRLVKMAQALRKMAR